MIARLTRRCSNASIASYVHTMISMASCAKLGGHLAYIDWRDQPSLPYRDQEAASKHGENAWDWFMHQPMVDHFDATSPAWVFEESNWRRIDGGWELPWNAQDAAAVVDLQRIVPTFLKFKTIITERAESLFKKYNLDPANTIAISHRGTDKSVEATIAPIESFYRHIDEREGIRLWVKAEERETAEKVKRRFPQAVAMDDFYHAPSNGVLADLSNPRSGYEKAFDALTTLCMLSRCRVLLKNAGNLADLAAGLSTGEVVCVGGA